MLNFIKDNKTCLIATFIFIVIGIYGIQLDVEFSQGIMTILRFIAMDVIIQVISLFCEIILIIPYFIKILCGEYPFLPPVFLGLFLFLSCFFTKKCGLGNVVSSLLGSLVVTALPSIFLVMMCILETEVFTLYVETSNIKEIIPQIYPFSIVFFSSVIMLLILKSQNTNEKQ